MRAHVVQRHTDSSERIALTSRIKLPPRKADQCRRNARYCGLLANAAATEMDRHTLLTMQQSWLALAENEEWLEGRHNKMWDAGDALSA